MADFKSADSSFVKKSWMVSLLMGLVSLVVFLPTMATYLFPGEATDLIVQWMGLDTLRFPLHPIWGGFVKWLGAMTSLSSAAVVLNGVSVACGVVATVLVTRLVCFFVYQSVTRDSVVRFAPTAAIFAGIVSALTFMTSTVIWQSATHMEFRMFDLAFALIAFSTLLLAVRCKPGRIWLAAVFSGIFFGVGILESAMFVALVPLAILALVVVAIRRKAGAYLSAALFLLSAFISFLVAFKMASGSYLATAAAAASDYTSSLQVLQRYISFMVGEVGGWFGRLSQFAVVFLVIMPFVACLFAARRGLNNERSWSQYLFHIAITFCVILASATALSPEAIARMPAVAGRMVSPYVMPVATTTLIALVAGYLVAYWFLLFRAEIRRDDSKNENNLVNRVGHGIAPVAIGVLCFVLALSALINSFSCSRSRGRFATAFSEEVLNRLGTKTWFVTDGTLDNYLRVVSAEQKKELNLICLQRDLDEVYLKELAALIKEKDLKGGRADLQMTIQLGVLPFLQDWFMADRDITSKVSIYGVPDFWYMAEKVPVPNCLFFDGGDNVKSIDGKKAKEDMLAFWKTVSEYLVDDKHDSSSMISEIRDPVQRFKLALRRHVGFVANNLGVALQDAGFQNEAFDIYELVMNEIDADNVCTLFNEFEMARRELCDGAKAKRNEIDKKVRAIVQDPRRRYYLWSLSRYYGYIRSPEIFLKMGYGWARSGQTGNAIAQVQRAIDLVPSESNTTGLMNMMAAIYASGNEKGKSREIYEQVLAKDAANHAALMGLTRLSLEAGKVDEARGYLETAVKSAGNGDANGIEWALLHLMNNDLTSARLAMQKVTDLQPKNIQAWSLLAGILLQQYDSAKDKAEKTKTMDELENVILPRMESIANSPRDYFLQITRALVLLRKGPTFAKNARDALVAAQAERPDVTITGDMILNLDISLDDGDSAEKHARTILRRNRTDKLANYVMGSLRLKEGDYSNAETYLRISCENDQPIGAALNDMAEVLRRLQRFSEAEKYARMAVKTSPDLYVAWETLGSSLLDQNKNLDEAEECVKKAIALSSEKNHIEDIRMQITLARVQIARGDLLKARGTLRSLAKRQSELSNYDRNQLEKLNKMATSRK